MNRKAENVCREILGCLEKRGVHLRVRTPPKDVGLHAMGGQMALYFVSVLDIDRKAERAHSGGQCREYGHHGANVLKSLKKSQVVLSSSGDAFAPRCTAKKSRRKARHRLVISKARNVIVPLSVGARRA
jgi:hypothetical protein